MVSLEETLLKSMQQSLKQCCLTQKALLLTVDRVSKWPSPPPAFLTVEVHPVKIQGLASASRNHEVSVAPPGRGRRQAARSTLEMGRFLLVGICYFVQITGCLLYRQENLTILIKLLEQKAKLLFLLQLIFQNRKCLLGDVQSQTRTEQPLWILKFSNHIQWSCMENENLGLAFLTS